MKAFCCYRLIPYGEVIHSKIDTDTHEISGMPAGFIACDLLSLPEYNNMVYLGCETLFDQMCESILLSNDDYCLVIEANTVGYYVLQWDGVYKFLVSATDDTESKTIAVIPNRAAYKAIGYRVTKPRQVRSNSGIYRLTACVDSNTVITEDGVLCADFDISTLDKLDKGYSGYKDSVINGNYGVVYKDGRPVPVNRIGNKLVLDC